MQSINNGGLPAKATVQYGERTKKPPTHLKPLRPGQVADDWLPLALERNAGRCPSAALSVFYHLEAALEGAGRGEAGRAIVVGEIGSRNLASEKQLFTALPSRVSTTL